jgi:hypothetical protein
METYRAKIARLEAKRDRALRQAPFRFFLNRLLVPLMVLAIACFRSEHMRQFVDHVRNALSSGSFDSLWSVLGDDLVSLAVLSLASVVWGRALWRLWRRPPPAKGDLWAYSDRCDYDSDDDPRVVQAKINALQAQNADPDTEVTPGARRASP